MAAATVRAAPPIKILVAAAVVPKQMEEIKLLSQGSVVGC